MLSEYCSIERFYFITFTPFFRELYYNSTINVYNLKIFLIRIVGQIVQMYTDLKAESECYQKFYK